VIKESMSLKYEPASEPLHIRQMGFCTFVKHTAYLEEGQVLSLVRRKAASHFAGFWFQGSGERVLY